MEPRHVPHYKKWSGNEFMEDDENNGYVLYRSLSVEQFENGL
jgi:hypothetical protein